MSKGEIVILVTQATSLSNGHPTGAWAEEVAAPYYIFKDAGYSVTIATPNGGAVTWDKNSLTKDAITPLTQKYLDDEAAIKELNSSIPVSKIDTSSIVALFAAGGHGAAVDFPDSPEIANLVKDVYSKGKVVSSVCHGAEIFKSAVDQNGVPIVKGKTVTGFSDSEEKEVGLSEIKGLHAPETILKDLGANYSRSSSNWGSYVEVDRSGTGPLVTGQNPGSSEAVAHELVKVLSG
jgi:putative intracellular protease/amidase